MDSIQSVIGQTYPSFELLLVDDGSTDHSLALVSRLSDSRIRIISHDRNLGAAAARNSGIKSAKAPLIAFLDSDDIWKKNKLERHLAFHHKSGAAATCTSYEIIRENTSRMTKHLPEDIDWQSAFLYGCQVGPGSTLIAERSVFDRIGYMDETLKRLEDWDWLLRLVRTEQFATLDEVLSEVRVSGYPAYEPVAQAIEKISVLHRPFLVSNRASWSIFKSGTHIELAYVCFHNHLYGKMFVNLFKSFISSPLGFSTSTQRILCGRLKATSNHCNEAA